MEQMDTDWDKKNYKNFLKNYDVKGRAAVYKSLIEKVQFMHEQGVIHCDLKPNNIFCD